MYSNGLDLLTLSRLLGHSDTTITMRVYLHEMPDAPLPDIDALLVKQGTPEGHRRDTAPPDITGYAGAVQPEETAITSGIG